MRKQENAVIRCLHAERNHLTRLLQEAEQRLQDAPEGAVRIIRHGKGFQFFHREGTDSGSGRYIPKSQAAFANALAQKQYDQQLSKTVRAQIAAIDQFLERYEPNALKDQYAGLHEARKEMITPAVYSDEAYRLIWQSQSYEKKAFREGSAEHFTDRGERVRSKSEVLIANALHRARIPYRYEYPLRIKGQTIHPDFMILRMRDRAELYWEHLGLMDDTEYREHALQRIRMYERCGIYPGDRLVLSMESMRMPLNLEVVNGMIRHYFE